MHRNLGHVLLSGARLLFVLVIALGATVLQGQTMGQQVSPESLGADNGAQSSDNNVNGSSGNSSNSNGYPGSGQQAPSAPLSLPGTLPMNDSRVGVFGTGSDIPQTSVTTQVSSGDLLDVVIFDTPELSGRFRVNHKGDILLPLAGSLHVGDLTVPEITDAVAKRYKDAGILVDPQVTVFVAEFAGRSITITGEVQRPGVFAVAAPRTLTDTLAMAGGLGGAASRTVSIVHAADPDNIIHVTLNVGPQTLESIKDGRMEILPGDHIYVARSGIVYMVGELNRPGGYQVEHNNRLTLLEAIALAGGPTRYAKLGGSRLIRRSQTGREELTVDLHKVLFGGGPDMLLTDGDIVYVPTSLIKQYSLQSLDAAISSATSYAIFSISNF